MIKVNKNKILIEQLQSETELGNGISINQETQSRKDVVTGLVISTSDKNYENCVVYFPLYAALPLTYQGKNYLIVDIEDILAYDSKDSD